jgi:hypothetical protein
MTNVRSEASRHFRIKRGSILETKLMILQRLVRRRTLETCIEEQINLCGATNLSK